MADGPEESARRLLKGSLTFRDFLEQIRIVRKLGPLSEVVGKIPGLAPFSAEIRADALDEFEKMLSAMTPAELQIVELFDPKRGAGRCVAVARRAGVPVATVKQFVKTFHSMERVVAKLSRGPDGLDWLEEGS